MDDVCFEHSSNGLILTLLLLHSKPLLVDVFKAFKENKDLRLKLVFKVILYCVEYTHTFK